MQRGDVERGDGEEEEETSTRRGRRDSRASQRSRPYSTARPVVSNCNGVGSLLFGSIILFVKKFSLVSVNFCRFVLGLFN